MASRSRFDDAKAGFAASWRAWINEWRVTRIRSTPAVLVGYVKAVDAEDSIKQAIETYGIASPNEQARQRTLSLRPTFKLKLTSDSDERR
jgi:hypothetical protein